MIPILILIVSIMLLYLKIIKPYTTWTKRGVKQTNPFYILGDSAGTIFRRESLSDMARNLYNSFPRERYFGMYQTIVPTLMIRDPELIKALTTKNFDHFINRRSVPDGVEPLWSKNLVSLKGNEWKQMRISLTPNFTSSKMKSIFTSTSECCDVYIKHFQDGGVAQSVELKDLSARYVNDVIANVAFGVNCNSIKDKDNELFSMAKNANMNTAWTLLAVFAYISFPTLCKALNVPMFPRRITKVFKDFIKDTIRIRKEKGIVHQDMISLLIKTRYEGNLKNEKSKPNFSDEEIAAQAFIFHIGGFQTVAAPLCFMGHTLATHPDIQRKLQEEIDRTTKKCEGKLTFEALQKMKYLDMVVSESLRMWPSLPVLNRVCTKLYTLPPSSDNAKSVQIFPGEPVLFPIVGLHYDPEYFADPEKFDPERFSDENADRITPHAYMPFGLGPRNCIGARFAMLEIKIFYFYFLLNFDFVRTEKTVNSLILNKCSLVTEAEREVWIGIKPRNKKP